MLKKDIYNKVYRFLMATARGCGAAVKRQYILKLVRRYDNSVKDRDMRRIYADMIAYGYPVGSNNSGYYAIVTNKDLNDTIKQIKARIKALNKRMVKSVFNFNGTRQGRVVNY